MIAGICLLLCAAAASAQSPSLQESATQERAERDPPRIERTGSRLGTNTTRRLVVRFDGASEIRRVLQLLERGETDAAVGLASEYLESLDGATITGASAASERYFALNALCVALVKAGRTRAAVEACSEAIDRSPARWTALNSRGTAYFAERRFDEALADYRRALEVAPSTRSVRAMIEHNIELCEQRLAR